MQDDDFPTDKSENYYVVFLEEKLNFVEGMDEETTLDAKAEISPDQFQNLADELHGRGPSLTHTGEDSVCFQCPWCLFFVISKLHAKHV